jgi:outer membrane protein assembly factor BamB
MNRWMLLAGLLLAGPARGGELPTAAKVLKESDVSAGLAVVVGTTDGQLEADLAADRRLLVQGLALSDEAVTKARAFIHERRLDGAASVDRLVGKRLPYTDNLVNLVVSDDLGGITTDEVMRVLAPLGVAYVRSDGVWTKTRKPWPREIDEWTHFRHDAGGTMMASDTRVGPARHVQWWGGPWFCRSHELTSSVSTMVSAGGRLFYVFDEGLVSLGEKWHKSLAPVYRLVARDAFNGILLWKHPIPDWGLAKDGSRMGWTAFTYHRLVAEGDRVYITLGMKAPVSALNAASGENVTTYAGSDGTEEILVVAGTLVCRAAEGILAFDAATGRQLWSHASKSPGLRAIAAGAAGVAFADGGQVSFVELATGRMQWTHPLAKVVQLTLGDSWLFCQGADGLSALAIKDGRQAWQMQKYKSGPFHSAGNLFYGAGTLWLNATGLDPATGQEKSAAKGGGGRGHHPRCYPPKATQNYILTNKRGLEYLDLKGGGETPCDWTRGACGVGILPANGLTYVPPNQCMCYQGVKLNGFWAYAAAVTPGEAIPEAERLQRGPAFGRVNAVAAAPDDWPAYRRDARLSASTPAAVTAALGSLWRTSLGEPLTSPVVAQGLAFVAAPEQHTLYALDAGTGKEVWRYVAGGRIDSPPTFHQGLLLFGAADGWVYALRAEDGALAWRYMMAPEERRVCSWGRIESAWPVHGAVLVLDSVAYAVAGRSTYLDGGVRICAFEPATGRLLHEITLAGPDPKNSPVNGFWMEGAFSDLLVSDGEHIYMAQIVLDKSLKQIMPQLMNKGGDKRMGLRICATMGFLTDPWYSRGFWMYARRWPGYRRKYEEAPKTGTLLCFDDKKVCVLKAYHIGGHSHTCYPAREGYFLFADDVNTEPQLWGEEGSDQPLSWLPAAGGKPAARHVEKKADPDRVGPSGAEAPYTRGKPPLWTARVPIRVHGMVLAAETLFLAGPPDVVDAKDPLASFQGRMGGKLWAVSAADGKKVSACDLSSPPVFDGMAAAHGRLYLSLMDGSVMCLAGAP